MPEEYKKGEVIYHAWVSPDCEQANIYIGRFVTRNQNTFFISSIYDENIITTIEINDFEYLGFAKELIAHTRKEIADKVWSYIDRMRNENKTSS